MSTKLIDMTKQLKSFLSSSAISSHLKETTGISGISIIEAHVRKIRLVPDRLGILRLLESSGNDANCLNIVNVAVAERNRRKGLFTDFLELLEGFDYDHCRDTGSEFHIRIDRVMNPVLDAFLPKRGYTATRTGEETHYSYHKAVRCGKGSGAAREAGVGLELAADPAFRDQEVGYTGR